MRTLYIECNMGAAGDMLMAALYELIEDKKGFIDKMNSLGIPGVTVEAEKSQKCGIYGTHMKVTVNGEEEHSHDHHHHHDHGHEHHHDHEHHHHHHHSNMHSIWHLVDDMNIDQKIKDDVLAVYNLIAEAESHAHNMPVDQIHFHEVGTMDALADITGVCILMDMLKAQKIAASPVHVGAGHVHCAHGVLPVPAPATAFILKGIPSYGGSIQGELCTPTGAALLKHFAGNFGNMPVMKTEAIGYGMGNKDFEMANCVRAFIGETEDKTEQIAELVCNIDDMTAEEISFAMEEMFAAGALDVYTTNIGMKKSRPAVMLTCMVKPEKREEMLKCIFLNTTTLGVREYLCNRYTLEKEMGTKETPYGEVRVKTSRGWGVERTKAEYEDRARLAREHGVSIKEIR